jgi:hypothetical protein
LLLGTILPKVLGCHTWVDMKTQLNGRSRMGQERTAVVMQSALCGLPEEGVKDF